MNAEERSEDVQAATRARGWPIKVLRAGSESDLESAFATLGEQQISGLLVQADPFFFSQRHRLASLALRHAVPAIYEDRGYVEAGGLISYGANRTEPRRAGGIINLKVAKTLGLTIPSTSLATADEVIE